MWQATYLARYRIQTRRNQGKYAHFARRFQIRHGSYNVGAGVSHTNFARPVTNVRSRFERGARFSGSIREALDSP